MNNRMKKTAPVAISATLLATALTGCSFGSGNEGAGNEEASLKVMYYDEGSFFQEYGMLFSALHPNINIEVVSTQSLYRGSQNDEEFDYEKARQEFLDTEKPDIVMLDLSEYEKMAQDGRLSNLDTYIAAESYDIEGLVPGVIDYMKELGGGQLYGLPSNFNSQVLYYNKSLFDKYSIAHPTDKMTWSEVMHLAKQFPTDGEPEDRVYGLKAGYSGDLHELTTMLAQSEGLSYVNPTTQTMTINTAGWRNAMETALEVRNSDVLYFENRDQMGGFSGSYEDYLMRNPFLSGRLAMMIEGSHFIQEIKRAKEYITEEGLLVEDWDMVTSPVSTQYPDESSSVWYGNIFAIANDSPNPDSAWKFISYIFGDEFARVKSMLTYNNGFSLRTKYIKDEEGRNYSAFYQLKPSRNQMNYRDYEKLPPQFNMLYHGMMMEEIRAVQDGTKSVSEALELLQLKGEELLVQDPMTDDEIRELQEKQWEEQRNRMMESAGETIIHSDGVIETITTD